KGDGGTNFCPPPRPPAERAPKAALIDPRWLVISALMPTNSVTTLRRHGCKANRRTRGRREGAGTARGSPARSRAGGDGSRPRVPALRPLAGVEAGNEKRDRLRGGRRAQECRIGAQSRDDHARGSGRRRLAKPDPA